MAIINSININQAPFAGNRADSASRPVIRHADAGNKANAPQNIPVPLQRSGGSRLALGQRQATNASLNDAARSVRTADKTMKTIGKHISSMKSQLDIIVKHYPPFLTTSPERIKALRSFSAFRREIDALTIPPRDSGAAKIMADPTAFPQAGNQTIGLSNGGSGTIQSQPVHTGPSGLDIPVLSDMATDAEINTAINSLDAAQITLGLRQEGLSMNWATIVPSGKYADGAAEQKSIDLGKTIAREPSHGFTSMRPLLLQMA